MGSRERGGDGGQGAGGAVRVSRQEVLERSVVAICEHIASGDIDDRYGFPDAVHDYFYVGDGKEKGFSWAGSMWRALIDFGYSSESEEGPE